MNKISDELLNFNGINPFKEAQARKYDIEKVTDEFFPIPLFWDLFNNQHEILIGTRGSGKTILLKMLSYSCLRKFKDNKAQQILNDQKYIGIYVPLHLELMGLLPGQDFSENQQIVYFQYTFNCLVISSFLTEISNLIIDNCPGKEEQLFVENKILNILSDLWFDKDRMNLSTIQKLQTYIQKISILTDIDKINNSIFSKPLLSPLKIVIEQISDILKLESERINWLICIDEAEFLKEPYIKSINTFLRSEARPFVIKMATLPFKHSTKETNIEGISIEPNGNDFNYRNINLKPDSIDFKNLTNHILSIRLKRVGLISHSITLEAFLGIEEKNDNFRYFYEKEFGEKSASKQNLILELAKVLSPQRKKSLLKNRNNIARIQKTHLDKFAPLYYLKKMKIEASKGNRQVGFFVGPNIIRHVSEGNPRRLIQLFNNIFDFARKTKLSLRNQHKIVSDFCENTIAAAEGLPEYGIGLKEFCLRVGQKLADRIHGAYLQTSGCDFKLGTQTIDNKNIIESIKLGVGYSFIVIDDNTTIHSIDINTIFRLSYLFAIKFWLPLRKGDCLTIDLKESNDFFINKEHVMFKTSNKNEIVNYYEQLELELK